MLTIETGNGYVIMGLFLPNTSHGPLYKPFFLSPDHEDRVFIFLSNSGHMFFFNSFTNTQQKRVFHLVQREQNEDKDEIRRQRKDSDGTDCTE